MGATQGQAMQARKPAISHDCKTIGAKEESTQQSAIIFTSP